MHGISHNFFYLFDIFITSSPIGPILAAMNKEFQFTETFIINTFLSGLVGKFGSHPPHEDIFHAL
jgi:hypothetical protein